MEVTADIADCKKLLDELDDAEQIKDDEKLIHLSWIFEHLPIQVAPRLQKDYDACMLKSHDILAKLFEKIDVSDKQLLNSLLKLLLSYGHMRMSQITYYIETPKDESFLDPKNSPIITKTKWYDLTPLLPAPSETSSLSWKHLMIHTLVLDEPWLFQTSFKLMIQKLHFHAILFSLNRYKSSYSAIKASGENLAEKIGEKIFDLAHDDCELISIDSFLFNLLIPFTSIEQQSAIIEAIILARFKTQILEDPELKKSKGLLKLDTLISEYVINDSQLQEILFKKLVEQLKCNIIRRKRRHSMEASDENAQHTVESCLNEVLNGSDPVKVISAVAELEITNKKLQKTYLKQWIEFIMKIISRNNLAPKNSGMLIQVCSIILLTTSGMIGLDLSQKVSILLAKVVDSTSQRWSASLFKMCGPEFLIELTKCLSTKTELLNHFNTPLRYFYSSYFAKYMRISVLLKNQQNVEKFSKFIIFLCDNTIGKESSHILEYILLKELAEFVDDTSAKCCNKLLIAYIEHHKVISNKLYKFIRKNLISNGVDTQNAPSRNKLVTGNCLNGIDTGLPQTAVIDALVCVLKIAIEREEQDILDKYGELMLRLSNLMCSRTRELVCNLRTGSPSDVLPIDEHLSRLMSLYANNQSVISPYLCYDLSERISEALANAKDLSEVEQLNVKLTKKENYNEIKTKLDALQSRGSDSELVYQTLINRQYNSVVNQVIAQSESITREDMCCAGQRKHMNLISELASILFDNCDHQMYTKLVERTLVDLEECDALDHAKVLYLFLIVESLLRNTPKDDANKTLAKEAVPRISCCLIRISKLVELGPSIHSFTNAGSHKSVGAIQCCTYSNCIRLFTFIFRRYPAKEADQFIADAMQICVSSNLARYAKNTSRLHNLFIQLSTSMADLLKSVCIGRKQGDTLNASMPIFLSVFTNLVRCVIMASDRQKLDEIPCLQMNGHGDSMDVDESIDQTSVTNARTRVAQECRVYETKLEHLAHDIGRLMNNLSFLESKLVEYAPHVICTYVKDTQRASCPDFVKKHLDEGVFRIFNLIDAFQKEREEEVVEAGVQRKTTAARASGSLFDMIYARLDQASREIFKNMHENYNKFHRYQGKC